MALPAVSQTPDPQYVRKTNADAFIERYHARLSNRARPEEAGDIEYNSRWNAHTTEREQFRRADGKLDLGAYFRSDVGARGRKLVTEGVKRCIARELNRGIDEAVADELKNIKITDKALAKTQYAIDRYGELTDGLGLIKYEMSFYPLADKDDMSVIDDVLISLDQENIPSYTDSTGYGNILSIKRARTLGKKFAAWGHSHGVHPPYFSSQDDPTMNNSYRRWAQAKSFDINWRGETLNAGELTSFRGIILNSAGVAPALRVLAKKPKYVVENGEITLTYEELDFENGAKRPGIKHNKWLKLAVQGTDSTITEAEKKAINEDLLKGVKLNVKLDSLPNKRWPTLKEIYSDRALEEPAFVLTPRFPQEPESAPFHNFPGNPSGSRAKTL